MAQDRFLTTPETRITVSGKAHDVQFFPAAQPRRTKSGAFTRFYSKMLAPARWIVNFTDTMTSTVPESLPSGISDILENLMINALCTACMNSCKQQASARIVRCPKFRKRLSENEFRDLVNELDTAETRAAELSRRVKDLIARATSGEFGPSPEPSGASGDSGDYTPDSGTAG